MGKRLQRLLSMVLSLVLILSTAMSVQATEPETNAGNASTDAEISMEATDSFGEMLTTVLEEETAQQKENHGFNIFSIEMESNTASVSLETEEDAMLVVGIYDEAGTKMLASGSLAVTPEDTDVTVTINTDSMPEYFYLRGFLVDEENYKPYSAAYESPNYTKEMQEFLAKTTDDFDSDRILNFDEDKTTNFAVYNEETVVVEETDGVNEVQETNENTYVFENADTSITSLSKDDIFTYEYEDGTVLILKVATLSVNGTTATITGQETSMEEVFDYVKIEGDAQTEDAVVDPSTCSEGVTYEGLADDGASVRASSGEGSFDKSFALSVDKEFDVGVKIKGSLNVKIGTDTKFYFSGSYQYLEIMIDPSVKVNISLSDKVEGTLTLMKAVFTPVPGVNIVLEPQVDIEISGKIELSGTLESKVGFKVSNKTGMTIIASTPKFETELKTEISVFIGFPLKPRLEIINEKLVSVELGAKVGVEISGTINVYTSEKEQRHQCENCIDGEIKGIVEVSAKASLFDLKWLTWEAKESWEKKVTDFYWSIDYGEFAFTTCPHQEYLVIMTVRDSAGNAVSGVTLNDEYVTGSDGKAEFYLPSGEHEISIIRDSAYIGHKKIHIVDESIKLNIRLNGAENKISGIYLGGTSHSIAITEDGGLWEWGGHFERSYEDPEEMYVVQANPHPQKIADNIVEVSAQAGQKSLFLGDNYAAITEDGDLLTWNMSSYGKLEKILDNVKKVEMSGITGAAIKEDGSLWMWGMNQYGQLGNGTDEACDTPQKIMDDVKLVYISDISSMAIKEDGSLWMWGFGPVGNGTDEASDTPQKVMEDVKSMSTSEYNSAAIKEDGSLWMWGNNFDGQLGSGTDEESLIPQKVMEDVRSVSIEEYHCAAIKEDGSLWMWGKDFFSSGIFGNGIPEESDKIVTPQKIMEDVKSVSLGRNYSAAIKEDGSLWTWGNNWEGQLGNGAFEYYEICFTPQKIMNNVKYVTAGADYCAAIKEDGSLWMWGYNAEGQLGNGTTTKSYVPINITKAFANVGMATFSSGEVDNFYSTAHPSTWTTIDTNNITTTDEGTFTASFSNLIPGETYNFYVMKSKEADNAFDDGNLLYMQQFISSESGKLEATYASSEEWADEDVFIAGMSGNADDFPFYDVNKSDWYYVSTDYVNDNGMMNGLTETTFGPNKTLTRSQFATIMYRMNGSPEVEYTAKYPDVPEDEWYTDAVLWASEIGVVNGYGNGNFGSNDNVTREQMAVMMYRYANDRSYDVSQKTDINQFADAGTVSSYAQEALKWASGSSIILGKSNGTMIDPLGNATRAEGATIIMRFVEKYKSL